MGTNLMVLRRCVAAVALAAAAVGCAGDSALAPAPAVPDAATRLAASQGVTLLGFQQGADTLQGKWRIPVAQASVQRLGAHMVTFPARAICEPGTSSYGPQSWDAPCTPANRPVMLTVRAWMDKQGQLQLSFSPDIRFVPSEDPTRWVMLYMKEQKAAELSSPWASNLNIVWVPTHNAAPVDESLSDPSLATQASPVSGYVWRRIKHFSGYTVAAGRSATSETTQDGTSSPSGY